MLEVRHELARTLHDNVIQRLFAIGMSMERITGLHAAAPVADRLGEFVDELDATISEIREQVFSLRDDDEPARQQAPTDAVPYPS